METRDLCVGEKIDQRLAANTSLRNRNFTTLCKWQETSPDENL